MRHALRSDLEHRAGIEPAYTGFADLRVSRFATGAEQWSVNSVQISCKQQTRKWLLSNAHSLSPVTDS